MPVLLTAVLAIALQSPDSLTLEQALGRAATRRSQPAAAAAGVAEARAALRSAGAIPNPGVAYSHSGAVPTNHLLVDQPLDWLLRRSPDRAAARADVTRARADSALTLIEFRRDVRLTYWRARAGVVSRVLVEEQAAQADTLARIAGARLAAGDISRFEQEQVQLEAARAHQAVSVARESARAAQNELARAVGTPSATPVPVDPLDTGLDRLPRNRLAIGQAPAVAAAVADSSAAAARARSVGIGRLPLPTLQSGAEWGDPGQPGTHGVIGIAIPLPLWNRAGGLLAESRARTAAATARAREARLEGARRAREARIHLEETALRARAARDSLIPAAEALRALAFRGYQAGETGVLPVIEAVRAGRDFALAGIQDQLAYQEAVAEWLALTDSAK